MTPIQQLIKEVKNLKPVPAIASQIVEMADRPSCNMADIAEIIQYDPAMTAHLLRTCNSAYFGLSTPVESAKDAVSILGIDQIVELALLNAGSQQLILEHKGYDLRQGALWKHAVASALIAKEIAKTKMPEQRNTIFTAALLKDIGKVVLDRFIQSSLPKIEGLVQNYGFSFIEAEKEVIGTDHAEIGAMISKMWKFSPTLVKIIRHHHLTDQSMQEEPDVAIVYLADCICMMMGIGIGADALAYRFDRDILNNLEMNPADISQLMADFTFNMQKVENLLNII